MMNERLIELVLPDGHCLAVHSWGDGQPIVLLHGFPLDATLWRDCVVPLSDHGFHVLAPDLRGFGQSGALKQPVCMAELANDIEHLRASLVGQEPIALAGLSLGGYVALEYWRQHRAHLSRLILCNTKPQADTQTARQARLAMADKALEESTWAAVSPMLEKLLGSATREHDGPTTQLVKEMMTRVSPTTVHRIQHAMAQRRDFTELLGHINLPTLVVTGRVDPISPPEENERWSGQLPQGRLEIIEQAAHLPPLESPDEFNRALLKFLS